MPCELSIIIPVYNVAPYLRHCLQSVLDQELDSYEVILVNDASKDNSRGICSEWCADHPAFKLINHSQNLGLSEARNTGLRQAQGKYITFIDSDDFIAPNTLKQCLAAMPEADVIEYPIRVDHLSNHAYNWEPKNTTLSFDQWLLQDGFDHCYACNKVFRHELWQGITFPPGKYFEDIFCIPQILKKAKRIVGIKEGLYYYCARTGSISRTHQLQQLRDYTEAMAQLVKFPMETPNTALYIRALNGQRTYQQAGGKEKIVPYRPIPWKYILSSSLTMRQRLKALYYKLYIHE